MAKGIRRNVYYPPDVDRRLSALGRARGVGKGEATGILLDERDGDWRAKRHELRGPLNAIGLEVELARRAARRGDGEVDAHLANIRSLVDDLSVLLARPGPGEETTPPAGPDGAPPAGSFRGG